VRIEPWLIGRLHTDNREDRLFVPLEEIPEALIQGLTLVEDKQFFEHHGISLTSILRALVRNIQAGKTVQGGSTLTQQLIKNLFLSREKSIIRKAQEAMMALLIELRFSKERILELYLNEVYLGQNGAYGIHGFGLASEFYFGAPLNELQLHQISTLIGMVKGPFLYHPRRSPTLTQERRDLVLRLMFENKLISRWKYQSQIMQPLKTTDYQSQNQYAALMDKVKRELDVALNHKLQRTNGLSVFTSFDPHMQVAAQNAVQTSISTITKSKDVPALQGAMVVSDYTTGQIKAIVGDKNGRISGFNRAIDARRPIGSLIKPLVYLLALEQSDEFNLASVLKDEPIKLRSSKEDIWQPQNADKQYRGQVLMLDALRQSLNVPTVNLGMQVGVENVVNQLKNIGVDEAVQQYPAVLLGSVNLSSLAVSQVFQTIANEGQWRPLHSVRAVMNDDGRLIWLHAPQFQNKVDKAASQLVKYAMQQVVTAGTGKQVGSIFADYGLAGKTGTTDDNRDSWFMGMDGRHNVVTWIGNDDNLKTGLTGASGAMQAYIGYAQSENLTPMTIDWVPSVTFNHAHQQTGKLFTQACADTVPIPIISSSRNVISDGDCGPKSKPKKKSFWQRLWGKGE
jgi:penicillin-binding protein 1B